VHYFALMMQSKRRYTCICNPLLANTDNYAHSRQVIVELPVWSYERKRRLRNGLTYIVCIDICIVEAIKVIWLAGIETTGCCCGHNAMPAWVSVHQAWYEDMFKLGYVQKPVAVNGGVVMGLYTFYL
jgi:hypothetical protein